MFGKQGVIPGITEGNPATMELVTESDNFRSEIIDRQRAEDLFRKVDNNERFQNTNGYVDEKYFEGDLVLFKEMIKFAGQAQLL